MLSDISGTFDDDKLGKRIAQNMIRKKADVLFTAAGFTGVGALKEAEAQKYTPSVLTAINITPPSTPLSLL